MKKRYLLMLAVLGVITGLVGLGMNRQNVVESAQSIIAKDKVGDDIAADMKALNDYVHSHTRASVNFTLEGSYQRAVEAAQQAAQPTANTAVYNAAIKNCQVKDAVATAKCMEKYIQTHATPGTSPKPVVLPDRNSFVYQLNSPGWAPDLAGLSFLTVALCLALVFWLGMFKRSH
jgi:hypothetical protein